MMASARSLPVSGLRGSTAIVLARGTEKLPSLLVLGSSGRTGFATATNGTLDGAMAEGGGADCARSAVWADGGGFGADVALEAGGAFADNGELAGSFGTTSAITRGSSTAISIASASFAGACCTDSDSAGSTATSSTGKATGFDGRGGTLPSPFVGTRRGGGGGTLRADADGTAAAGPDARTGGGGGVADIGGMPDLFLRGSGGGALGPAAPERRGGAGGGPDSCLSSAIEVGRYATNGMTHWKGSHRSQAGE